MNRRTFFQRTVGAIAAAVIAPAVQWKSRLWTGFYKPATGQISWMALQDIAKDEYGWVQTSGKLIQDETYFMSKDGPMRLGANLQPEPMWSDLKDG